MITGALAVAVACAVDCAVTGFAYGANKTKIRFLYGIIISIFCSLALGASLILGEALSRVIPISVTVAISSAILITIGVYKILDSIVKNILYRKDGVNSYKTFSLLGLRFVINISGELDNSGEVKELSAAGAVILAIALSLDGLGVGFGAGLLGLGAAAYAVIIAFSFVINAVFLFLGRKIGVKTATKTTLNLAWVSGLLLIVLALFNIFA